jgi:hypothetical protein
MTVEVVCKHHDTLRSPRRICGRSSPRQNRLNGTLVAWAENGKGNASECDRADKIVAREEISDDLARASTRARDALHNCNIYKAEKCVGQGVKMMGVVWAMVSYRGKTA